MKMEEVFRSNQHDVTLIHRVVKDENGKFNVEFPVVGQYGDIEEWNYVGGAPGLPTPTYDSIGEAIAFIEGIENGLQGLSIRMTFKEEGEQRAYDEGLKFGLEL